MKNEQSNNASETSASIAKKFGTATTVNLDAPGVARLVASEVLKDIDGYCVKTYDDGFRNHLGASLIGDPCKRKLWFGFRWSYREVFSGRMLRLFNRGHREEDRFVEYLRGVGFKVWTHDESQPRKADGTYPQFRISWLDGHGGGSLDGVAEFPPSYGIPTPVLLEFKTNGTGAGFNKLVAGGMRLEKPQHFAQTSSYGMEYGFNHVLYLNTNKNDDDIHCEIVKLDHKLGQQMKMKAEQIILAQVAPPRLSDNPTHFQCTTCAAKGICHNKEPLQVNCRSCGKCRPIPGGEWFCDTHGAVIPANVIRQGCPSWTDIRANG